MSDELRRLLDDRERSRLHSVLEAGLRDGPSRGQLARAARGLGVGAAGLGAAQSAAAQSARALHASVWTSLAKWGAAGLLLGGAALSPLVLSPPPRAASVPQPSAHRVSAAAQPSLHELPAAPVPPAAPASPAERLVPRVTSAANVAPPQPVVAPAAAIAKGPPTGSFQPLAPGASSAARAAIAPNLDAEVALLDSARSAVQRGDPAAALIWLERHARLSTPSLAAEATLLRVQALVAAGRSSEARAVARRAIGSASTSAYAQRLNKLAGLADGQ